MRTTVLSVLLALAVVVALGVAIYRFRSRTDVVTAPTPDSAPNAEVMPSGADVSSAPDLPETLNAPASVKSAPVSSASPAKNRGPSEFRGQEALSEEMVEAKVAELAALTEVADTNSLRALVRHLDHPMPAIRVAALTEIVNVASRDAIPMLKEALGRTADPREKVKIIEAIEYLELPTLTEWRKAKGKLPGSASPAPPSSAPVSQP